MRHGCIGLANNSGSCVDRGRRRVINSRRSGSKKRKVSIMGNRVDGKTIAIGDAAVIIGPKCSQCECERMEHVPGRPGSIACGRCGCIFEEDNSSVGCISAGQGPNQESLSRRISMELSNATWGDVGGIILRIMKEKQGVKHLGTAKSVESATEHPMDMVLAMAEEQGAAPVESLVPGEVADVGLGNLAVQESNAKSQIGELADFIMDEVDGEPSASEGAVDCAIRIIKELQAELERWKKLERITVINDLGIAIRALKHFRAGGKVPIGGEQFPNDECCHVAIEALEIIQEIIDPDDCMVPDDLKEYTKVIKRIEELMSQEQCTPDEIDEINKLSKWVDRYEDATCEFRTQKVLKDKG